MIDPNNRELREATAACMANPPATDGQSTSRSTTSGDREGLLFYPFTDVGNAERLVHLHGADIRFCHPWGKWLTWDGRRWAVDQTAEIIRRAKATTRQMFKLAGSLTDADRRDKLHKLARDTEKAARLHAMITLASAEEGIPILIEHLDSDPWVLNVLNGTIDLRTGTLRPHDRKDLITKLAPVFYDTQAQCPTWLSFQRRITDGNEELMAFKQRAIGYALTGIATAKRALFIYHGPANAGKTTEVELLRDLLGDYAGQIRIEALMEQKHNSGNAPSPDIADLRGLRLVVSSEPAKGQRLAESLLKYLTGMGTIKARHLHKENFEFRQTWKLFLDCNDKPEVKGTDNAIWNRIGLVPFNVVIPENEIDKDLPAKLRAELPGILSWAIEGCLAFQRDGLGVPELVRNATEGYRSEMDVIGRFIEERCTLLGSLRIRGITLYENYVDWCQKTGEKPENVMTFGSYDWSRKEVSKTHDRKGVRYDGIGLADVRRDDL